MAWLFGPKEVFSIRGPPGNRFIKRAHPEREAHASFVWNGNQSAAAQDGSGIRVTCETHNVLQLPQGSHIYLSMLPRANHPAETKPTPVVDMPFEVATLYNNVSDKTSTFSLWISINDMALLLPGRQYMVRPSCRRSYNRFKATLIQHGRGGSQRERKREREGERERERERQRSRTHTLSLSLCV